jgi:hypothetical protein
LSRVLDPALAARWVALARNANVQTDGLPKADGRTTRGQWVRAAFKAAGEETR